MEVFRKENANAAEHMAVLTHLRQKNQEHGSCALLRNSGTLRQSR